MTWPWISRREHERVVASLRAELYHLAAQILALEAELGRGPLADTAEHRLPRRWPDTPR